MNARKPSAHDTSALARGSDSVSVVIPCFNAVAYVTDAVSSAFAQTYAAVEVIVVDDGSTDGSYELLLDLQKERFPKLTVLTHKDRVNRGVSISRHLGVLHAASEWIAFLDADDVFLPEKLARQMAALLNNAHVILCHTGIGVIGSEADHSATEAHFSNHPSTPYRLEKRASYLRGNAINNSTVLVRRSAVLAVPFAMPQVFQFEDWLCWNLLSRQGAFLFLDERLTLYRMHDASASAGVGSGTVQDLYGALEMKIALFTKADNCLQAVSAAWSAQRTVSELVEVYIAKEVELSDGTSAGTNLCVSLFRWWWRAMKFGSKARNRLRRFARGY